jgi:hypothetical protein
MRVVYLVILVVLLLAIVLFAVQNDKVVAVRFMEWAVEYPLSLVVGAVARDRSAGWRVDTPPRLVGITRESPVVADLGESSRNARGFYRIIIP